MSDLKRLRKALFTYRLGSIFPFLKEMLNIEMGFCRYFSARNSTIPRVLHHLRPQKMVNGFWFPEGELKPRIKLLKQAIKKYKTS